MQKGIFTCKCDQKPWARAHLEQEHFPCPQAPSEATARKQQSAAEGQRRSAACRFPHKFTPGEQHLQVACSSTQHPPRSSTCVPAHAALLETTREIMHQALIGHAQQAQCLTLRLRQISTGPKLMCMPVWGLGLNLRRGDKCRRGDRCKAHLQ